MWDGIHLDAIGRAAIAADQRPDHGLHRGRSRRRQARWPIRYSTLAAILAATVRRPRVDRLGRPGRLAASSCSRRPGCRGTRTSGSTGNSSTRRRAAEGDLIRTIELPAGSRAFSEPRRRASPPRPATWDRDEDAVLHTSRRTRCSKRLGDRCATALCVARADRSRPGRVLPPTVQRVPDRRRRQAIAGAGAPPRANVGQSPVG